MRVLLLSVLIVVADQITKLLVRGIEIPALGIAWKGLPYGVSHPVLGDFVQLTYIENPGMAFGIDLGGKLFLSLFSLAASIALLMYLYHVRRSTLGFRLSLALILGGAVGNLIDRTFYGILFDYAPLFHGRVVDFFDVDFFDIDLFGYHMSRWAIFNISDACVTIGVLMLVLFHRSSVAADPVGVPVRERPAPETDAPGDRT